MNYWKMKTATAEFLGINPNGHIVSPDYTEILCGEKEVSAALNAMILDDNMATAATAGWEVYDKTAVPVSELYKDNTSETDGE